MAGSFGVMSRHEESKANTVADGPNNAGVHCEVAASEKSRARQFSELLKQQQSIMGK